MFYYVYLLEGKDKSWYIGYTADLGKRFASHNKGENKATKSTRPWKLIYCEAYRSRIDAKKRERFLKSGSGRRFLKNQLKDFLKGQIQHPPR